jgi:hypothetical protein
MNSGMRLLLFDISSNVRILTQWELRSSPTEFRRKHFEGMGVAGYGCGWVWVYVGGCAHGRVVCVCLFEYGCFDTVSFKSCSMLVQFCWVPAKSPEEVFFLWPSFSLGFTQLSTDSHSRFASQCLLCPQECVTGFMKLVWITNRQILISNRAFALWRGSVGTTRGVVVPILMRSVPKRTECI